MENITDIVSSSESSSNDLNCEDLTNNGLYFIFTGYIFIIKTVR